MSWRRDDDGTGSTGRNGQPPRIGEPSVYLGGRASALALRQGFLVGLPAGRARADVPGVGGRTSYESHYFPAVRTRYLLGHFRFHGAPLIGPNDPSVSPSPA